MEKVSLKTNVRKYESSYPKQARKTCSYGVSKFSKVPCPGWYEAINWSIALVDTICCASRYALTLVHRSSASRDDIIDSFWIQYHLFFAIFHHKLFFVVHRYEPNFFWSN